MRYVLIETKSHVISMIPTIMETIETLLEVYSQNYNNQVLSFYTYESEEVIKDTLTNLSHEWVIDFKIFISNQYSLEISKVIPIFKQILFNHTIILYNQDIYLNFIKKGKKEELKVIVLKEFMTDLDMHQTIKIFIESNQNSTQASQMLYIHRNTLNQRLDKFMQKTGLNPKNFKDAYIIYYLLT